MTRKMSSANWRWLLVVSLIFVGCDSGGTQAPAISTGDSSGRTATADLTVIFNSERNDIEVAIPCSRDSTVFSILERAQNIGDLKFESTGEGETVFVTSIGGVDNEKGRGDNWVYRVNGELGDRSCGIFPVEPGDQVTWTFGKYPE